MLRVCRRGTPTGKRVSYNFIVSLLFYVVVAALDCTCACGPSPDVQRVVRAFGSGLFLVASFPYVYFKRASQLRLSPPQVSPTPWDPPAAWLRCATSATQRRRAARLASWPAAPFVSAVLHTPGKVTGPAPLADALQCFPGFRRVSCLLLTVSTCLCSLLLLTAAQRIYVIVHCCLAWVNLLQSITLLLFFPFRFWQSPARWYPSCWWAPCCTARATAPSSTSV